jgi:hypothetical protein
MHYYITKAESGHQACLEADYQGASNFDVDILGAISESGEKYANDGEIEDLTSIDDAEYYVRELMYITTEYKQWREHIRQRLVPWVDDPKTELKTHAIEDIIKFFKDLSNRDYYIAMTIGQGVRTFEDGLRFASSSFGSNGATNMYSAFDWHDGEMWVVFIQNEI